MAVKKLDHDAGPLKKAHDTGRFLDPKEPLRNAALGELREKLTHSIDNAMYIPREERFRLSAIDTADSSLSEKDRERKEWFETIYKRSKYRKNNCAAVIGNLEYLIFNHVGNFGEKERFRRNLNKLRKELETQERAILEQEDDLAKARTEREQVFTQEGINKTLAGRKKTVEDLEHLAHEILMLYFFPDKYREHYKAKQPLRQEEIEQVLKQLEEYESLEDTLIG
ncbi:hypothetical protein HY620_02530 [Candidatus Uhrbacteria bacterium]|nr:hypothetical protein [Candidatus Uhrbacteria bacterium]